MAVTQTTQLSIVLFRVAVMIFAIILAFQLLGEMNIVPFDFTEFYTFQQITFIWIILVVTILAFIEARTMQNRLGGGLEGFTIGVVVAYAIAFIGIGLTIFVFTAEDPFTFPPQPYEFNSGVVNQLIGYYLLVGALLIFINARKPIFRIRSLFQ